MSRLAAHDIDTITVAMPESRHADTVHGPQWPQGHIVVETDGDDRHTDPLVFVDLGPVLNVWSGQGASMTPSTVQALGRALLEWAERRAQRLEAAAAGTPDGASR